MTELLSTAQHSTIGLLEGVNDTVSIKYLHNKYSVNCTDVICGSMPLYI